MSKPSRKKSEQKISEKEFVLRAIDRLHKPKYKGIHTVFSGFNTAFREYYGNNADPVVATQKLAAVGAIVIMPSQKGVIIYKKGEEPRLVPRQKDDILDKILK